MCKVKCSFSVAVFDGMFHFTLNSTYRCAINARKLNEILCKLTNGDASQFIRRPAFSVFIMTRIADVIELVGSSDKSWQVAAQVALGEARKTIHEITGLEIGDMTAKVDPITGNITEYHTYCQDRI